MQMEEQEKQGGGKLSAEETSQRKAAAEAEVQRNLELEREWDPDPHWKPPNQSLYATVDTMTRWVL